MTWQTSNLFFPVPTPFRIQAMDFFFWAHKSLKSSKSSVNFEVHQGSLSTALHFSEHFKYFVVAWESSFTCKNNWMLDFRILSENFKNIWKWFSYPLFMRLLIPEYKCQSDLMCHLLGKIHIGFIEIPLISPKHFFQANQTCHLKRSRFGGFGITFR